MAFIIVFVNTSRHIRRIGIKTIMTVPRHDNGSEGGIPHTRPDTLSFYIGICRASMPLVVIELKGPESQAGNVFYKNTCSFKKTVDGNKTHISLFLI